MRGNIYNTLQKSFNFLNSVTFICILSETENKTLGIVILRIKKQGPLGYAYSSFAHFEEEVSAHSLRIYV